MYTPPDSRRFAYPTRLPKSRGRGPWAIASFIAIPLFFSSLMASTLAQEKPRVVQWNGPRHLITIWHEPTGATEARIWLWAIVPPVVLSVIGFICMRVPYGWYLACFAGIVEALAVVHRIDIWTLHHTQRFKIGVDLIPATNPASNQYEPGEWEHEARATALSLAHWTIALASAAIVVMALLYVRRTYFARKPYVEPMGGVREGVHAPDATMPIE
jgi:hypothetical protein